MRRRAIRIASAVLAVSAAVVGGWALLAPRSFYDDFPGGGRHWVSADGPYNEHLVRDVGSLNLALALVLAAAAITMSVVVVRTAMLASLVNAAPHFLYHALHLDTLDTADAVGNVISLGLAVALPVLVLVLVARDRNGSRGLSAATAAEPMVSHGSAAPRASG